MMLPVGMRVLRCVRLAIQHHVHSISLRGVGTAVVRPAHQGGVGGQDNHPHLHPEARAPRGAARRGRLLGPFMVTIQPLQWLLHERVE